MLACVVFLMAAYVGEVYYFDRLANRPDEAVFQIFFSGKFMTSNGFARNTLGPSELRLASKAFEAALAEVGESELHPYTIRKSLAQHVMSNIFAGERDATRLSEGALSNLRSLEAKEVVQEVRFPPHSSNENIRALFLAKA